MRKPPAVSQQSQKVEFFEDFPYPSSNLSAFLFIPGTKEFVLSLRDTDGIVRYQPQERISFVLWLWKHGVRDIGWQIEHKLKACRN